MTTPPSGAATPRKAPHARRRGNARNRGGNPAQPPVDDTEQVRKLRSRYTPQLAMLSELFPEWSDEDLLFVLQESNGEVEVAAGRISEGHAEQFSSVKTKRQTRKEHAAEHAAAASTPAPAPSAPAPAPAAAAQPAEAVGSSNRQRARGAERAARGGRGAQAQAAARGGRGGFRGVGGRGGAAGGAPRAAVQDSTPVATTAQAFGTAAPAEPRAAQKEAGEQPAAPKGAMSWAQIARPAEKPKPAPAPAPAPAEQRPAGAERRAPSAPAEAPAKPSAAAEPPVDPSVTQAAMPPGVAQPSAASVVQNNALRQRPRQDAAVVMPGGSSALDRLGVQFGTLQFGGDAPAEAQPAEEAPANARGGALGRGERLEESADEAAGGAPAAAPQGFDAFRSNAFGGYATLGGRAQPLESGAPAEPTPVGFASGLHAQPPAPGHSSVYGGQEANQRLNLYNGYSGGLAGVSRGNEEKPVGQQGPPLQGAPPGGEVPPNAQQPGMHQQQFANMMPYYYPYYMPNQFQQYASPAAGFGQYPMYGGQPQNKPDAPSSLPSPYTHSAALGSQTDSAYGTHTPGHHYQQAANPGGSTPSYDAQGFAQRMPHLGGSGGSEFKLPGADAGAASGGIGGLGGFFGTPGGIHPQQSGKPGAPNSGGAPAGSSPLDYRGFDAGKSPSAGPASAPRGPGGIDTAPPAPSPQPMQQQPAYYQQYAAGFGHQAGSYGGYPYGGGRQPYWG